MLTDLKAKEKIQNSTAAMLRLIDVQDKGKLQ